VGEVSDGLERISERHVMGRAREELFPSKLTTDELLLREKEWQLAGYCIEKHSRDLYIGIGLNFMHRVDEVACYRRRGRSEKEWVLAYKK